MDHNETNKMIRQVLKEAFPGVKFSVRKDGRSTRVSWVDGPTEKQVDAYIDVFKGAYFDGMIDYQGYNYITIDGEKTGSGATFIFTNREESDEAYQRAIDLIYEKYRVNFEINEIEKPSVEDLRMGRLYNVQICGGWSMNTSLQAMINQEVSKRSRVMGQPSPTRARVDYAGSDNYGQGGFGESELQGYPEKERKPAPADEPKPKAKLFLFPPTGGVQ